MKTSLSPSYLIIGLFALLLSGLLTSCETSPRPYRGDGVSKTIVVDTNITYPKAITAPRYGCPGNRLANDQIVRYQDESMQITQICPCELTDQELNNQNYYYGNRDSGDSWWSFNGDGKWFLNGLEPLIGLLLLLLAVALIFWILRELWYLLTSPRTRTSHHTETNTTTTNNLTPAAPQGTWVRAGDSLAANGMAVIPITGLYIPPKTAGERRLITIDEYPVQPVEWAPKKPAAPSV